MPRNDLIQLRSDTAASWASVNPTLAIGETGFETDTGKLKVGTGSTAWNTLLYVTDASDLAGTIPSARISGSYTGITGVGTVTAGTWNASVIAGQYGGTGVANTGKTITLGGNLTTSGAFTTTLTVGANTSVTLPTSGTLATTDASSLTSGTLDSARISGSYTGITDVGTLIDLTVTGNIGWSATTYLKPVYGGATQYGSVRVTGTPSAAFWEGYNINGNAVFMSNSTQLGLYDNSNLEWSLLYTRNGSTAITFNGATKVETSNTGATTTGTHTATAFSGNGASVTTINADNISSGTLANARLPDTATTITSVGTLTSLTSSGSVTINRGALGTASGNSLTFISPNGTTSNGDSLNLTLNRTSAGTTWTTAAWKFQRLVDATTMGYIQFGEQNWSLGNGGTVHVTGSATTGLLTFSLPLAATTLAGSQSLSANNSYQSAALPAFGFNAWAGVSSYNFYNASDIRYKTNVQQLPLGLDFIKLLNPVKFTYIYPEFGEDSNTPTSTTEGSRLRAGLSAQNVKQALETVDAGDYNFWALADKNDPESFQALDYTGFVAPIIKAIQELDQRLQQLEESNV